MIHGLFTCRYLLLKSSWDVVFIEIESTGLPWVFSIFKELNNLAIPLESQVESISFLKDRRRVPARQVSLKLPVTPSSESMVEYT